MRLIGSFFINTTFFGPLDFFRFWRTWEALGEKSAQQLTLGRGGQRWALSSFHHNLVYEKTISNKKSYSNIK